MSIRGLLLLGSLNHLRGLGLFSTVLLLECRANEGGEERVGLVGLGLKLRVGLRAEEPRVILELDDLDEIAARIHARDDHAATLELADVGIVDLVAMAVALADAVGAVGLVGERAGRERALVAAEPHGP